MKPLLKVLKENGEMSRQEAVEVESYWLFNGFFVNGSSIGQIETESMEDCIEQGERWKSEGKKEFKFRGGLHYVFLKGK